jgi:serralysin
MANFIFEEGTQTQASGFTAGDILYFKTASPTDITVTYTPASGLSAETVTLTSGTQSLTFAASALGAPASDIVFIAAGGELVIGTPDIDTLAVSSDDDSALYAFDGNDVITVSGAGDHVLDGGAGNDTVTVTGAGNHTASLGAGVDVFSAAAATGNLFVNGGAGGDAITTGSGADRIFGNAATTVAGAADGNDTIDAGAGNDYVNGNAGNDSIDGGAGRDRLFGGSGNDTINGGTGDDTVNGNLGNDVINGDAGNDSLRGGQGDDVLNGGTGNDVLQGDLGNDTITGGTGADIMTGGEGADTFNFVAGDAAAVTIGTAKFYDTITDFTVGEDTLNIGLDITDGDQILVKASGVSFDATAAGVTAAIDYANGLLAGAAADTVAAIQVGGDTYLFYEADGEYTATASVDSFIKLTGVTATALSEDDFVTVA